MRDQRGGAFMAVVGQAKPGLAAAAVIPVLRRILTELGNPEQQAIVAAPMPCVAWYAGQANSAFRC